MARRLKKIIATLEEEVARWARVEAAKEETSVSRLLGDLLKRRMEQADSYQKAVKRALARKPFGSSDGKYLTREELHDRARFR